jgi:hypothetical protein
MNAGTWVISRATGTTVVLVASCLVAFALFVAYRLGHRAGTRGYLKMLQRAGSRLGNE